MQLSDGSCSKTWDQVQAEGRVMRWLRTGHGCLCLEENHQLAHSRMNLRLFMFWTQVRTSCHFIWIASKFGSAEHIKYPKADANPTKPGASLRPPANSPPSNSSSVNGLASQSTQQLAPQHQATNSQSQSQPPPQQQQQRRPVYPWTARRLNLLPPTFLSKNAPPSGPSPSPFPRYGHALPASATAAGELFLFGGLVQYSARNDLYVFSTRDLSATLLQTSGEIPSPRVGHAGALVGSVLLIWGGDTNTSGQEVRNEPQDDSLYFLNLSTSDL